MKRHDVAKLWYGIGTLLFVFSIDVFLRTTSTSGLSSVLIDTEKVGSYSIGIFGIIIGTPLIAALLFVTSYYRDRWQEKETSCFVPWPFEDRPRIEDRLSRSVRRTVFWAFLILPVVFQFRFLMKTLEGNVVLVDPPNKVVSVLDSASPTMLEHFVFVNPAKAFLGGDFRHQDENGVTYFPFWEPLFLSLSVLLVTIMTVRALLGVRRAKPGERGT